MLKAVLLWNCFAREVPVMRSDRKIFFWFGLVFLVASMAFASLAGYSRFSVEPVISEKIGTATPEQMKEAYLLLRKPQLFAGYDRFDSEGMVIRNILRYFDKKVYRGVEISPEESQYLELLLSRRKAGSHNGFLTAIYALLVALGAFLFGVTEKKE